MTEEKKTRTRRAASSPRKSESPKPPVQQPVLEAHTIQAALDWLSTVDAWSVGGHRNLFPRWVYLVALLFFLT